MRIAIDAMGGDFAPRETVRGAVEAAQGLRSVERIVLVGDETAIKRELDACGSTPSLIDILHASETVDMDETPALAIRRKKDASVSRAIDLVKAGDVDAVVSAGNTGAVVVAATLKLRTLAGVDRPAIAAVMPTRRGPLVLVDAGANMDCGPELLMQFAAMGSVYAATVLHVENPLVGLLSIGGEATKGNEITKDTHLRLSASPLNFRGNVEGHDIFEGETDVVVCDGFIGNVVLKTSESAAMAIAHWMRREFKRNPWRLLGAALLNGALKSMKRRMDPEGYGGAPLLGVNGVCIITHGASSSKAIYHATRVASESVHNHLNDRIVEEVARTNEAS